jgi:hypothetical protein
MNKNWKEELEEYGDLHNLDCDINDEGGSFDGCHCQNIEMIKQFVESYVVEPMIEEATQMHGKLDDYEFKQQLRASWLGRKDTNG